MNNIDGNYKKIVFVLGNYKNGGMAMRATNLANEFAKMGYEVIILIMRQLDTQCFFEINSNIKLVSFEEYHKKRIEDDCTKEFIAKKEKRKKELKRISSFSFLLPASTKTKINNKIRLLKRGNGLRTFFLENDESIVIPFGMYYLDEIISATQGLKAKIVYAEKNDPRTEYGKDEYNLQYAVFLLKKVSSIIVQTHEIKEFFESFSLKNIHVINNPIRPGLPLPYSGARSKVIVSFCRTSPQKNLELLVNSFCKLHQLYPEYTLRIYGNSVDKDEEDYKTRVKMLVDDLQLTNVISLYPPCSDVHNEILDAAMFVSSSDYEGLSNSMIEAMAIGLPCICTDCSGGGTREVMTDGINGQIVPTNDVNAMFMAMKQFAEDPIFANRCGKSASEIRNKLSIEMITKQWINVINS